MSPPDDPTGPSPHRCACGTEVAPRLLVCPVCHRLVHADRLRDLTREAQELERSDDLAAALTLLRQALVLLPSSTRQHAAVSDRVRRLSDRVGDTPQAPTATQPAEEASVTPTPPSGSTPTLKRGAALGGLGLLLWKFKFILVFVFTKAKLLLLGLSKSTTLLSMLLSLGVYWTIWGWRFALGLVLSIYVHEMGHVAALRRFGIPASAPMFLPGLGAMVRMNAYPQTPREDARIGLAGPIYGLACAAFVAGLYWATRSPLLAAVASVGAWINLFNLVPVWTLDGGRGFRALGKRERWALVLLAAACAIVFQEGLYVVIAVAGGVRAMASDAPAEADGRTTWQFAALLIGLGLLASVPVPVDHVQTPTSAPLEAPRH